MMKKGLLIFIGILFFTISSSAQEKKPWWKNLFKKETVEENQTPSITEPIEEPTIIDTVSNENIPVLTPTVHKIEPLTKVGGGEIAIHNSLPLDSISNNLKNENQEGFRIQIYFGSLDTAKGIRARYIEKRTGDQVYLELKAPNYVVVVGNYRNKIEAYQNLHRIQKHYPKALIVNSTIE